MSHSTPNDAIWSPSQRRFKPRKDVEEPRPVVDYNTYTAEQTVNAQRVVDEKRGKMVEADRRVDESQRLLDDFVHSKEGIVENFHKKLDMEERDLRDDLYEKIGNQDKAAKELAEAKENKRRADYVRNKAVSTPKKRPAAPAAEASPAPAVSSDSVAQPSPAPPVSDEELASKIKAAMTAMQAISSPQQPGAVLSDATAQPSSQPDALDEDRMAAIILQVITQQAAGAAPLGAAKTGAVDNHPFVSEKDKTLKKFDPLSEVESPEGVASLLAPYFKTGTKPLAKASQVLRFVRTKGLGRQHVEEFIKNLKDAGYGDSEAWYELVEGAIRDGNEDWKKYHGFAKLPYTIKHGKNGFDTVEEFVIRFSLYIGLIIDIDPPTKKEAPRRKRARTDED